MDEQGSRKEEGRGIEEERRCQWASLLSGLRRSTSFYAMLECSRGGVRGGGRG